MSATFVIRGYHWGYNDETFYPCGSYIKTIFTDEQQAQQTLIELEREHWSGMDLGETDAFFNSDEAFIEKVNAFVSEKCGKTLISSDDPRDTFVPAELSDEDFMEFLNLCDLSAYKLTKFASDAQFYAIWLPENEEFLMQHDEYTSALVYGESIEALKSEAAELLEYHFDGEIKLSGSLEDLSNSPSLLQSVIANNSAIKYVEASQSLTIKENDFEAVFSVNELLKKPLFEIRSLTLDQVKEIEDNLVEEYD